MWPSQTGVFCLLSLGRKTFLRNFQFVESLPDLKINWFRFSFLPHCGSGSWETTNAYPDPGRTSQSSYVGIKAILKGWKSGLFVHLCQFSCSWIQIRTPIRIRIHESHVNADPYSKHCLVDTVSVIVGDVSEFLRFVRKLFEFRFAGQFRKCISVKNLAVLFKNVRLKSDKFDYPNPFWIANKKESRIWKGFTDPLQCLM